MREREKRKGERDREREREAFALKHHLVHNHLNTIIKLRKISNNPTVPTLPADYSSRVEKQISVLIKEI